MNLKLIRKTRIASGIFGVILDDQDQQIAVTLEHAYRDYSGNYGPKLPRGVYTCKRGTHALKDGIPFEAFEILNVPGHTGVLFHVGNYNEDSEGCVLLGDEVNGNMITQSKDAFKEFMALQEGCDEFQIQVDP